MVATKEFPYESLEDWYSAYANLAVMRKVFWICTGNPLDYKDMYDSLVHPETALSEDLLAAPKVS